MPKSEIDIIAEAAMSKLDEKLQTIYATEEWQQAQEKVRATHGQSGHQAAIQERDALTAQARKEYEEEIARGH